MSTPRILIVDDEPDIVSLIKDLFLIFKFHVSTAESGDQAWELLQAETFDVVISDIRMANGDGPSLLKRIKDHNVNTPKVFFISGYHDFSLAEALNMGVDGIFKKPFDASVLRESVQSAFKTSKEKWSLSFGNHDSNSTLVGTYNSLDDSHSELHFGRGGFAINTSQVLKEEDFVNFNFHFSKGPIQNMKGYGRIMWANKERVGVEILHLDIKSIEPFIQWVDQQNLVSFVPL